VIVESSVVGALLTAWIGVGESLWLFLPRQSGEIWSLLPLAVWQYALAGAVIGAAWSGLCLFGFARRLGLADRWVRLTALVGWPIALALVVYTQMWWMPGSIPATSPTGLAIAGLELSAAVLPIGLVAWWRRRQRRRLPLADPWRLQALPVGWRAGAALAVPLVVLCCLPWVRDAQLRAESGSGPSVLLIVMDTTRIDTLSAFGFDRPTTPRLEEIADEGMRFERAYASAPWTLSSHASIFTGERPSEHGAVWGHLRLDARLPTMAEKLASQGLRTVAIADKAWLNHETGLMRGFEELHDLRHENGAALTCLARLAVERFMDWRRVGDKGARRVSNVAVSWLDDHGDEPFFMFLNYNEAHYPWAPPSPYREKFLVTRKDTPLGLTEQVDTRSFNAGTREYSEEELQIFRELYHAELAYQDYQMGRVFDAMRERGLLDDTIVIVTADHGEHLGEHHLLGHEFSLYEPLLHVPLVLRYPPLVTADSSSTERVAIRHLYELMDAMRRAAGSSARPADLRWAKVLREGTPTGTVVAELFKRDVTSSEAFAGTRLEEFDRDLRALYREQWKLIWGSDGWDALFDLEVDPGELDDLGPARDEQLALMEAMLGEEVPHLEDVARGEEAELSDQLKNQLRSLGYME
jgi:arylsulfatase A-like enzyme